MDIAPEEVDLFFKNPCFDISIGNDLLVPLDHIEEWNETMDTSYFPLLISSMPGKLKYFAAKQRYIGLTLIINTCQHAWPYLFLALAEAHFWLSDISECSVLLSKLADSLVEKNPELDHIICVISALLLSEAIEDETYHNQSGADKSVHVFKFSTPMECPKVDIDYGLMELFSKEWDRMQSNEEDALEQFQRYACVSSNIIEDVFSLDGQSWPRLIRRGFCINSIDRISRTSKQKKKQVIVRILKNTMQSLELISQCLNNYDVFTCHFIQDVHRTMLRSDNFIEVNEEDYKGNIYPVFSLIPIGRFRNVACLAEHDDGKEVTLYCQHSEIAVEMDRYCTLARDLICDGSVDVFMKAAWLQWAFLRIHPFSDGNGRVARIISSIPLSKMNYPPIAVTKANKEEYFRCILVADRDGDLHPLSSFLHTSIEQAMREISDLPPTQELRMTSNDGKTRTLKGDRLSPPSSRSHESQESME